MGNSTRDGVETLRELSRGVRTICPIFIRIFYRGYSENLLKGEIMENESSTSVFTSLKHGAQYTFWAVTLYTAYRGFRDLSRDLWDAIPNLEDLQEDSKEKP
jgi:hypothetical protein